jgi:NADH-quinone oxidoreductase subunit G
LYENLEGRVQECKKAAYPIGEALEDWKIFNHIIKKISNKEDLTNFDQLRKDVLSSIPNYNKINNLPKPSEVQDSNVQTNFTSEEVLIRELDYYYTNSISRSSKTMSECRQINKNAKKDGTNN